MPDQPRVLIDEERIAARITELGKEIRAVYGDETVVCVGILKGSFLFMADLIRKIEGPVQCAFLGVASYEGTKSTGVVRITHDTRLKLEEHHVLVVEDIVDTGLTLDYILRILGQRKLKSLRVCALLDKPSRRKTEVLVDFLGFEIPPEFVIGYGLDLDEYWRNLPYVGIYDG
ncbi:MAG: hypoxanthine phosphoribosyltransferase [Deltaproteobacteria bacterium]|nr:hypoxanthine phosphoribosyltransferase [Deltaproteobacteria bacterium]